MNFIYNIILHFILEKKNSTYNKLWMNGMKNIKKYFKERRVFFIYIYLLYRKKQKITIKTHSRCQNKEYF